VPSFKVAGIVGMLLGTFLLGLAALGGLGSEAFTVVWLTERLVGLIGLGLVAVGYRLWKGKWFDPLNWPSHPGGPLV
jgi:hypothetical protein